MRLRLLTLLCAIPTVAYAIEPYSCRNGAFPTYDGFAPAEIVASASEHVRFRDDGKGCPADEKCSGKAYLVSGDKVLTAHPAEGWTCVYYYGKKGDQAGWMPEKNVKSVPFSTSPAAADWVGGWQSVGAVNTLRITPAADGGLNVHGEARWLGGAGPGGEEIVHSGQVDGVGHPSGAQMTIKMGDEETDCVVTLRLVGPYLLSDDNSHCGGMNVRFRDVSRRKR